MQLAALAALSEHRPVVAPRTGAVLAMAPRERLELLDGFRLLASLSVVFWHRNYDPLFGVNFGVPLFLVIMFGLASCGTRRESIGSFARRRAGHLVAPWVRWSLFLIGVLALRDLYWGHNPLDRLGLHVLWTGGHPYYWFLPFAAVTVVLAKVLQKMLRPLRPEVAVLVVGAAAAAATYGAGVVLSTVPLEFPFHPWVVALPTLIYGVALGQSLRLANRRRRAALLACVAASAWLMWPWSPFHGIAGNLPLRYAIAVGLACVGFCVSVRMPRIVKWLATTTFGIYLVHPLVVIVANDLVELDALPQLADALLVWGVSSLMVVALGLVFRRWPECGAAVSDAQRAALRGAWLRVTGWLRPRRLLVVEPAGEDADGLPTDHTRAA